MRRALSLLVLGFLAGPLAADQVVLKDGRTLDTKKPPVIKGRQAVLVLADGKLVSIPASEIDAAKTAALAKKVAEAPKAVTTPAPARAPTLADAARASQTAKKATVVLTDQDVAGGYLEVSSGSPEKGEGEVTLGPVTAKQGPGGYSVEGSVMNSGKAPVLGVSVTIAALGDDGKPFSTTYGQVAKDSLDPGEKATFTARLETTRTATTFRYVPRWKVRASAQREPGEEPPAGASGSPDGAGDEATPPPTPTPEPTPEPTQPPVPPGWAAPQANAPVGAPSTPGGTYIPQPSTDQPKPPGGV